MQTATDELCEQGCERDETSVRPLVQSWPKAIALLLLGFVLLGCSPSHVNEKCNEHCNYTQERTF